MKKRSVLICVDLQNDFMPGGSLAVPDGDKIIPTINKILPLFDMVVFTKDWHPYDSLSFASQHEGKQPFDILNGEVLWPDHCVQDTPGSHLHKDIDFGAISGDFYIFKKGDDKNYQAYSGFDRTGLGDFLRERNIDDVYVCGLATDYCCKSTAIDSKHEGFKTYFVTDAMKGISTDDHATWDIMQLNGITLVYSGSLQLS